MTVRDMQAAVQMLIEEVALPELHSDDMVAHLNRAQDKFVDDHIASFEQSSADYTAIHSLIRKDWRIDTKWAGFAAVYKNFEVDQAPLPDDLKILISQRARLFYRLPILTWELIGGQRFAGGETTLGIPIISLVQSDDIYRLLDDPFSTTRITEPLADIAEGQMNVYTDQTFAVDQIVINYVKVPRRMNLLEEVDCELPVDTHRHIVNLAFEEILRQAAITQPAG